MQSDTGLGYSGFVRCRGLLLGFAGLLVAACDDPVPAWHSDASSSELTLDRLAEIVGELLEARVADCKVERAAEDRLQVRLADGRSAPLYLVGLFETEPSARVGRIETRLSWFVDQLAQNEPAPKKE